MLGVHTKPVKHHPAFFWKNPLDTEDQRVFCCCLTDGQGIRFQLDKYRRNWSSTTTIDCGRALWRILGCVRAPWECYKYFPATQRILIPLHTYPTVICCCCLCLSVFSRTTQPGKTDGHNGLAHTLGQHPATLDEESAGFWWTFKSPFGQPNREREDGPQQIAQQQNTYRTKKCHSCAARGEEKQRI